MGQEILCLESEEESLLPDGSIKLSKQVLSSKFFQGLEDVVLSETGPWALEARSLAER